MSEQHLDALNHAERSTRLEALRALAAALRSGELKKPRQGEDVNNHIHTFYSFSPYSPAKAVWMGTMSGLITAGIMDHDSISGAEEFIEAGQIIGLATTIGVECRCDFSSTALAGRRINNPDQLANAYIALHGIPHARIGAVTDYFRPYLQERNRRNRAMVRKLNEVLARPELTLDFEQDVVPLSKSGEQGSITERHILFALATRLIERFGKGMHLIGYMENDLQLPLSAKIRRYLEDEGNPHCAYDLLGAMKSDLVEAFYVQATAECPDIRETLEFCHRIGAISAYAYLGDIGESVTGDKKSQSFEDGYLDLLFDTLKDLGFQAVTYMPNRNTAEQLERVQARCDRYGLFQISGVDINSPRQSFTCPQLRRPQFRHLIDSTWALIGHELEATDDPSRGMFQPAAVGKYPDLRQRIAAYKEIGRRRSGAPR